MTRPLLFFVAATCLVACQTPNPPTSVQPSAATPPVAEPLTESSSLLSRDEVQNLICAAIEGPCTLTDLQPAGDSENRLQVAEIAFLENADPNGGWKYPNYEGAEQCNAWALFVVDTSQAAAPKEVARFCNDGYGASGVGEDAWEVKHGRLIISTNGGSNWRWAASKTVDLASSVITSEGSYSFFGTNPNSSHDQSLDYEKMAVVDERSVWRCGEPEDTVAAFKSLSIPRLDLPSLFSDEGWRTNSLGECSTQLDSTGAAGFVIHGEKSTASDSSMKVVAHGNIIFVEVMDDQLIPSASGNWIHGDHLELWVSPEGPPTMEIDCVDLSHKGRSWQWGIDALTGTIHEAYGKPAVKLLAEQVAFDGGVRFKIALPADTKAVTVIYSDSDDGKTQERLVATSDFEFAKVPTMGTLVDINPERLVCTVADGHLAKSLKSVSGER